MVKLATFFDPDSNAWMLVQTLQVPGNENGPSEEGPHPGLAQQ